MAFNIGEANIETSDIIVIVLYFVIVMGFGIWSSLRNRGSVGGYFLAGRSMHFIPVGASLFASNIGSGHFIGLAGSGAASGIGIAVFELNALFVLLILGWVFVPVYIAAGVYTMPEYLRKRFGGQRIRIYLSVMAILLSIFTKVAADLYAGAVFIEAALGWDLYAAIVLLLAIAALFTICGGLTAVIWTDFVQTVIMIIGAAILMVYSFVEVGDYTTLTQKYFQAIPNTTRYGLLHPEANYSYTNCGIPPANALHLFRAADDGGLPWPGVIFGLTISSIWYWCSDQPFHIWVECGDATIIPRDADWCSGSVLNTRPECERAVTAAWCGMGDRNRGLVEVGGYEGLYYSFLQAVPNTTDPSSNNTCGYPPENSMHFIRPHDDPDYPWPGVFFGLTISSVWYWCSDQVIVQRALAAKNLTHAKAGTIMAGYLKILPMWLLVVPGMAARILYTDTVGCADPDVCESVCGIRSGCTNMAYPSLVINLMPQGLRGLMLAVMIAALMSSLTSIFNSSSTIFTMDIWRRIRKNAGDTELMIVGRVFVLAMVAIGIIWIPIVKNFSELFHYIQSITSYLAPPVCAVYVLAVAWKRINEIGAFVGLMVGLVIGLIRFAWEFSYAAHPCGEEENDNRPAIIKDVHYLHFGILLWGICTIVTIAVSLVTKPIDEKHLHRLTFESRYSKEERVEMEEDENDVEKKGQDNLGADVSRDGTQASSTSLAIAADDEEDPPCWKKSIQWICGIEKQKEPERTAEEIAEHEKKQQSLEEDPFWKKVCNINAVVVAVVAVFFWAFFY